MPLFLPAMTGNGERTNYLWLVGGLVNMNFIFPYIGNVIIPNDFHIFRRGWNHEPDGDDWGDGLLFVYRHYSKRVKWQSINPTIHQKELVKGQKRRVGHEEWHDKLRDSCVTSWEYDVIWCDFSQQISFQHQPDWEHNGIVVPLTWKFGDFSSKSTDVHGCPRKGNGSTNSEFFPTSNEHRWSWRNEVTIPKQRHGCFTGAGF